MAILGGILGISPDIININCLDQPITVNKAQTLAATAMVTNIIQHVSAVTSLDESAVYEGFAKMIADAE